MALLCSPNARQLKIYTDIRFAYGRDSSSHERLVWEILGYEEVIVNNNKSRGKRVEVLSAKLEVSLKRIRDLEIEVSIRLTPVRQDLAKIVILKSYICFLFNFSLSILNCESVVTDTTTKEACLSFRVSGNMDHELSHSFHWRRGPRASTGPSARTVDVNGAETVHIRIASQPSAAVQTMHLIMASAGRKDHEHQHSPWLQLRPRTLSWPSGDSTDHTHHVPPGSTWTTHTFIFLNRLLKCHPPYFGSRTFSLITYWIFSWNHWQIIFTFLDRLFSSS